MLPGGELPTLLKTEMLDLDPPAACVLGHVAPADEASSQPFNSAVMTRTRAQQRAALLRPGP
jgi:hypothetical protein